MSRTYKVTGINLKAIPLSESDRLVTILTKELGLIRVVAPGARKHLSRFAGRTTLFVVNNLLIAQGRSLDKIIQIQTLTSYPKLGQDLMKLTISQYLAEVLMCFALSDQPQIELFEVFNEHLRRIEGLIQPNQAEIFAYLNHAIFHLLVLAGIAPEVNVCSLTRIPITPDFLNSDWRAKFSLAGGGLVTTSTNDHHQPTKLTPIKLITAHQLSLLQKLSKPQWDPDPWIKSPVWIEVETILRDYIQFHFEREIKSGTLLTQLAF